MSRTPVKVKVGPSSVWFVALFIGLMLIGLVWLMVFQLAAVGTQAPDGAALDGRARPVELRHRVRLHDHRFVAHDALALTGAEDTMNSSRGRSVTGLATFSSPNHTRVIYPHC